ncbi:DUF4198 domain-containing protein [Salipiger mucosus]|uniref:DUF4198 domain-containing protein n=1 Tax=Salipiger mucosus DSM 16094 TaxID=1123237 RepID=S9RZY7_9RHOB|nr:DUF4198 domain-containing protein [Salipiger mucosus]EPX79534.1 hypothetical protein Salmuc_04753 [Salipiger mucosus DSM 16094]
MKTLLACLLLAAAPAAAHEFWIDPEAAQVSPDDRITARLRVGSMFEGAEQSYIPRNFERFDLATGGEVTAVEGRAGDRPALDMAAPEAGLAVVAHVTRDFDLTYDDWETFVSFTGHKGFPEVAERHLARGFTRDLVRERYSRYAKSLVAVGEGAGGDRALGLRTEVVAEANPYTDELTDGLPVRILLDGEPRAEVQVELYDRAPDGTVTETLHTTDTEGRVRLPVAAGHAYLVNSVTMLELSPDDDEGQAWESLWASLTFSVPE